MIARGFFDPRAQVFVEFEWQAKRLGDPVHRQVVMGGTDPARCDHVVVGFAHLAGFVRNDVDLVRDREDALEVDADLAKFLREKGRVRIHHLAREDFVSDDEEACSRHPVIGTKGLEPERHLLQYPPAVEFSGSLHAFGPRGTRRGRHDPPGGHA